MPVLLAQNQAASSGLGDPHPARRKGILGAERSWYAALRAPTPALTAHQRRIKRASRVWTTRTPPRRDSAARRSVAAPRSTVSQLPARGGRGGRRRRRRGWRVGGQPGAV